MCLAIIGSDPFYPKSTFNTEAANLPKSLAAFKCASTAPPVGETAHVDTCYLH